MASISSATPRPNYASLNSALAKWALRTCVRQGFGLHAVPYAMCLVSGVIAGLIFAAAAELSLGAVVSAVVTSSIAVILTMLLYPQSIDAARFTRLIAHAPRRHEPLPGSDKWIKTLHKSVLDAAAQQQRSASSDIQWTDLTARMSHELRTPLNAVIGFSEMMSSEAYGPCDEKAWRGYAQHIHRGGLDLLKAAEDALTITSLIAQPTTQATAAIVKLDDMLLDAWSANDGFGSPASTKDLSFDITAARGIAVNGDLQALRQVFINIIADAQQRATHQARISVTAALSEGFVAVTIEVTSTLTHVRTESGSLSLTLARTMLSLMGTSLVEYAPLHGAWSVTTFLDAASQSEFF